ncbi:ABC transporter ATP-binding protein [Zhengella mangrovi]|uniref:ABC transporter ATP-binding protein n=1 Tax=Zhengella mangrovi TaxID=1982044 RepID=A0A2G1QJM5_9HYPH|nr:ABC transporter ATP-binding protein [Zhengella mangrovi]PHP65660.1 ABC transporter ATP-binding protein [Zhengella mangrovi]
MSSDVELSVRGLGKVYDLHDSPWKALLSSLFGWHAATRKAALEDVNLDARPGDVIGIVGANGAGKSTLLEIIAGTRTPTSGSVTVRGRVAALLELGAGFNPDFSGLENARLSAVAYGLTPAQFRERWPAIVAFAGIGDFIRRPTREYSSGMFARLAFAVCAHVDADILIIDEILGVGDVQFQQKSMRFLREAAADKIILYVSHNQTAVTALCNRAIWIDDGRVVKSGAPKAVVHAYHRATARGTGAAGTFSELGDLVTGDDAARVFGEAGQEAAGALPLVDFGTADIDDDGTLVIEAGLAVNGKPASSFHGGEPVTLSIAWTGGPSEALVAFVVRDPLGQVLFYRDTGGIEATKGVKPAGSGQVRFDFVLPYLASGAYAIDAAVADAGTGPARIMGRKEFAASFQVSSRHISAGLANLAMRAAEIAVVEGSEP